MRQQATYRRLPCYAPLSRKSPSMGSAQAGTARGNAGSGIPGRGLRRLSLLFIITCVLAAVGAAAAQAQTLMGDQSNATFHDSNASGMAQAFQYSATTTGTASALDVYVDSGSTATGLTVGLYKDASGKPGALLATGSLASPKAAAWNGVTLKQPIALTQGQPYWIALLGTGGTLHYEDTAGGSGASYVDTATGLTSLPTTYAPGTEYDVSPASAYATGTAGTPAVLAGDQNVAPSNDSNAAGAAQAFAYTAAASGTATDIDFYANSTSTATGLQLGLYADSGGKPGALLTSGSLANPKAKAWNDVPVEGASLSKGTTYWIALLGTGGTLAYQDTSAGTATSYVDSNHSLSNLPTSYSAGTAYPVSPASAYVNGVAASGTTASPPPAAPAPAAPVSSGAPVVSGTAQEGDTLTTSNGSWSNAPSSFAYQWEDCDGSGASCTAISGARSSSYALGSGDVGHTVRSVVTGSNAGGSGSATSGATGVVSAPSAPPPPPSGAAIYVAQNAAGSGNGADCSDAKPVSFFNTTSNWGSASGQIGPGVTVELCGTITSQLMAHGSGTTSSPITVQWTSGATLSEPVCPGTGCFDTNNQTDLTLNGGSNGSIQSTANGTGLAHQTSGVDGIYAAGCTGCTFENLLIENMYVHTSTSDTAIDGSENQGIFISGSNINILNNTIHDVGWAILSQFRNGDGNVTISNNNIYDIDHGFALTGTGGGITIGTVVFSHNNVHDFANWDTNAADAYHHDGVHCFTGYTGSYAHLTGVYIDDNTFGGQTGYNMNAMIFLEGGQGSGYTPCGDSTSKIYIFNNVFSDSGQIADGFLALYSTSPQIYNNTMMGYSSTSSGSNCIIHEPSANYATTAESFENNVISDCDNEIGASTGRYASGQPDYNIYAQGGSNAFGCNTNDYAFSQFSSWKSCIGGDSHSSTTSNALLNSNGSPQSGSPATAAGNNLTSLCTGNLTPLCTEINGTPRPTTGAWDTGAY
jgi:hypothetical protein